MKHYGCYSEKQRKYTGTIFYHTPEGKLVEVTGIYPDYECESNKWDDKVLLGEVTNYVRQATTPSEKIEKPLPYVEEYREPVGFSKFDSETAKALANMLTEVAQFRKEQAEASGSSNS